MRILLLILCCLAVSACGIKRNLSYPKGESDGVVKRPVIPPSESIGY